VTTGPDMKEVKPLTYEEEAVFGARIQKV